tara:strand:+ start:183 stop:386 length:204 start_codon:yes stop_codon:yes gene_type:complete
MNKLQLIILIYSSFITNAYAYLDPGTGSILLSAIVAGFVTIKTYWKMIVQKIKKCISKDKENPKKID